MLKRTAIVLRRGVYVRTLIGVAIDLVDLPYHLSFPTAASTATNNFHYKITTATNYQIKAKFPPSTTASQWLAQQPIDQFRQFFDTNGFVQVMKSLVIEMFPLASHINPASPLSNNRSTTYLMGNYFKVIEDFMMHLFKAKLMPGAIGMIWDRIRIKLCLE